MFSTVERGFSLIIKSLMFIILICLWAVIGFIVWIPLLLRIVFIYAFILIFATIKGTEPTITRNNLNYIASFYMIGFKHAYSLLFVDGYRIEKGRQNMPSLLKDTIITLAEIIFFLVFWLIALASHNPEILNIVNQFLSNFFHSLEPPLRYIFVPLSGWGVWWIYVIVMVAGILVGRILRNVFD